ncbi:Cof-type HAD-IIB family hydrolase [Xylocopilactobacillus apicola]|uniref:Sugar phosphatase SupH n=1 Tax=Xylocopilactobacillus apicola TaxID=2932184 RepID=A0AAU9CV43_9LACO|nr:Cof-type HAD-IIB family hydrolase [Xylocopilactobacillus apicola]BDR57869.1 sugar phosphatase SupH [Xylocopilactobacillus apicola]
MTVSLIAVDMDGTFLDDNKEYDRQYFAELFQRMQDQNVEFVVASGNQYAQLANFFAPYREKITFVSENGGNIWLHQEPIYHARISNAVQNKALNAIKQLNPDFVIACGFKSAYVLDTITDEQFKVASSYFPQIEKVESLENLNDDIIKYSVEVKEKSTFKNDFDGELIAVPTGGSGIDLILPGVHKAAGIKKVQERLNIPTEEVAAFGDNGNDREMLAHAHYSFAMENAIPEVKKIASAVIGNNNDKAVLKTIERLLAST